MQQIAYFVPLFLLVFGLSASVDVRQAWVERKRFGRGVVCGLLCQFVLLPFLGFCVVKIFDLGEVYGVTLLVVTSSPGGSYSNWWCSLLNADLALSVAMTTASTILSLGLLPLNLIIWVTAAYGTRADRHLRWSGLFLSIGVVLAAHLLGLAAGVAFGSNEEPVGDSPRKQKSSRGAKARASSMKRARAVVWSSFNSRRVFGIFSRRAGLGQARGILRRRGLPCLVGLALSTFLRGGGAFNKAGARDGRRRQCAVLRIPASRPSWRCRCSTEPGVARRRRAAVLRVYRGRVHRRLSGWNVEGGVAAGAAGRVCSLGVAVELAGEGRGRRGGRRGDRLGGRPSSSTRRRRRRRGDGRSPPEPGPRFFIYV